MNALSRNLNYIFWGTLLIIFDINFESSTNGYGLKIDMLNDVIGACFVFIGVRYLLKANILNQAYYKHLKIALYAASIYIYLSFIDFIISPFPPEFNFFNLLLTLFVIYGEIEFCKAMSMLSDTANDFVLKRNWRTAMLLILYINFIPYTLFVISTMLDVVGLNINLDLFSYASILGLFFFLQFISPIYILWVLYKTKQTIKQI
ncbi:hypothetical protein [Dokdonia sp.]|uniref:hypothetical protein n=1 Tax=Dokdonia sp. TaxID=2024995 RepID=UPI003266F131